MDGEFKVQLKHYEQDTLTAIFNKEYQNKLQAAYAKSAYNGSTVFNVTDFCAGSFANGSLLLINKREFTFNI